MNYIFLFILTFLMGCGSLVKNEGSKALNQNSFKQSLSQDYTFGRFYQKNIKPRGGNTTGPELKYDKSPSEAFKKIAKAKTKKEKDRAAILAQVGEFKVTFDFIETLVFTDKNKKDQPYQSWATEYVFPIKKDPNFISLQHILVMQYKDDQGKLSEPIVVKHWRQDWTYEKTSYLVYKGHQNWKKENLKPSEVKDQWVQEVFQVDDSPRYSAHGKWNHLKNMSIWKSQITTRPLPRREFSVRSDYDLLQGHNTVTVVPTGWYHEQENYKVVVDKKTLKAKRNLAKEVGLNTYKRIKDYNFAPGKNYWKKTSNYWQDVRTKWDELITSTDNLRIKKKHKGVKLYEEHFKYAKKIQKGDSLKPSPKKHAIQTIETYTY